MSYTIEEEINPIKQVRITEEAFKILKKKKKETKKSMAKLLTELVIENYGISK